MPERRSRRTSALLLDALGERGMASKSCPPSLRCVGFLAFWFFFWFPYDWEFKWSFLWDITFKKNINFEKVHTGSHCFPWCFPRKYEVTCNGCNLCLAHRSFPEPLCSASAIPGMSGWLLLCVICELKMVCWGTAPGCAGVPALLSAILSPVWKHQWYPVRKVQVRAALGTLCCFLAGG